MAWNRLSDSLGWTPGALGKGYLLHDGTIKTWNVDPFHPEDQRVVWQRNQEESPVALHFEIDPDGGVVTDSPTTKVEQIITADQRLYDAGQRPVFEDDFDLDHFEPQEKPEGKPNFNFVMSGLEDWEPETQQTFECPRCHGQELDDVGRCHGCGYVIPFDGWEQMVGGDADSPVPGWKAGLDDDDMYRGWFGDPKYGAWVNHPQHRNRWSGKLCDCPWGQPKHWHKKAGVNKRRLLKAPDKAYRTPQGKAFRRYIKSLPEEYDSLAPYLGMRFKKGDMRYVRPGEQPGNLAARLEFRDGFRYDYNQTPPEMVPSWRPVAPRLPQWQQWLEARQHPARRGVNILDPDLTPQTLEGKVQEHQADLQERAKKARWLQIYGQYAEPIYVFGPEAGKYKGWQIVKLDSEQAEGDSEALGHCIGSEEQPYAHNIASGNIDAFSLRDKEGYPKVSWHINPSGYGIGHMQGESGQPKEAYRELISMFNEERGLPDDETDEEPLEAQYRETYELPDPDSIGEYVGQYEDPWTYAEGADDVGPDTEILPGDPDWTSIAADYMRGNSSERFVQVLSDRGDAPTFASYLEGEADLSDRDQRQYVDQWNSEAPTNAYIDMPPLVTNEVDKYNDTRDEGDDPEPDNWDAMAQDYLTYPEFYGKHAENRWDPKNHYQKFHDNLAEHEDFGVNDHRQQMHEALQRNTDWDDPKHQEAIQWWNDRWPENVFPEPSQEHRIPGQLGWDWPTTQTDYTFPEDRQPDWTQVPYQVSNDSTYIPQGAPYMSSWHFADGPYGYTNYDTSTTALMIDNEQKWQEKSRQIVERGGTPEDLRAWATRAVIGPYNRQQMKDAKEWNAIPLEERQRRKRERDIAEFGEAAVNMGDSLMQPFHDDQNEGKSEEEIQRDAEYEAPDLIDAAMVNWDELHQGILDEFEENAEHERDHQRAREMGLGWATRGGDDYDKMRDAIYRYHGAIPGDPEYEGGDEKLPFNDPRLYHNRKINIPLENFRQMSGWPEHYLPGGRDNGSPDIFGHRFKIAEEKARAEIHEKYPHLTPEQIEGMLDERGFMARDFIKPHFPGGKYDTPINLEDPEERGLLESSPLHQDWAQNGYTMSLSDFSSDLAGSIKRGQPHPYTPQMQEALQQRGYSPEQIQQIMQPQWQWDEQLQEMIPVNRTPPVQQWQDTSLDQPGNLTFPEGWTSKTADATNILAPAVELREWLADLGGAEPISPHHDAQEDFIQAPRPSTADDLPYFPPVNVPKEYKQSTNRSLYHGTLIDHLDSIRDHGLQPDVGGFTSDAYGLDEDGNFVQDGETYPADELGVRPAVYMADKRDIDRAFGTMKYQVAQKLDKGYHDVTDADVINHGLLVKLKGGQEGYGPDETGLNQAIEADHGTDEQPYTAEPGDWWSESPVGGDQFIHGPKLLQLMNRQQPPPRPQGWSAEQGQAFDTKPYYDPAVTQERQFTGQKTASYPRFMFHNSPSVPDDILANGLLQYPPEGNPGYGYNARDERQCPPGVYMAPEEAMREWDDPVGMTYRIDTSHLDPNLLEPDEHPGAWRYRGDVPPHALEDFGPLYHEGSTKTADSPITQADATNDPLGKNPAIVPSRKGDPDYLDDVPCPHCQKLHRPDQPCGESPVGQYKQMERAWYGQDPNATSGPHGPGAGPDGLHDQQMDLGSRVGAAPMYHVAPTVDRERIKQHGLQPSDPAQNWTTFQEGDEHPEGVYTFTDQDRANAFRTMVEFRRGQPHDIWAIDAPGGGQEDPEEWVQDPDLGSSSRYLTSPVQPRLVEGPEHREDMPEYMQPQYVRPDDPWKRGPYSLAPGEGRGRPYPQNEPESWDQRVGNHPRPDDPQGGWEDDGGKLSNWDPLVCSNCQGPMTEPRLLGHKWINSCSRCKSIREIPLGHPLLKQVQQQEALSPYPELLQEVGPRRPWNVQAKVGAMTLPQQQRQWQALNEQFPNTSERVHEFPNGWSVQRPTSEEDILRVGNHMRNCWQGGGSSTWQQIWGPHSLHDENDFPRVAFMQPSRYQQTGKSSDMEIPQDEIKHALGPHNNPAKAEELDLLRSWAEPQGIEVPDWLYEGMPDEVPGAIGDPVRA